MNGLYRFIRFMLRVFVRIYFRLTVFGKENIPKEGSFILCCNHTSISDVVFLIAICPRPIHFMAKAELFKNPIVAWFIGKLGAFPVVRGSGGKQALLHSTDLLKNGEVLGIFPEGTRNREGRPKKGKAGTAFVIAKTGAPVLPVSIYRESLKPFSKVSVRIGRLLTDEIKTEENSKNELRRVTETIMGTITEQWERGF